MSSDAQPSVGRRIFWVIRTTVLWIVVLALLVGVAYASFLGVQELQRSLDSIVARVEANSQNISGLSDEMQGFRNSSSEQQTEMQTEMRGMAQELGDLDGRLGTLEGSTVADDLEQKLARQEEVLAGLQSQLEAASSSDETALGDIASLSEAVTALQTDINANSSQIDTLGGDVDRIDNVVEGVGEQTAVLETGLTELQTAVADDDNGDELREVLALFRVWELITRSRLRLAENNIGLAQADVETAVDTLELLAVDDETAATYSTVQGRLALAAINLPDDPETAAADLETAWDELDAIIALRILPERPFELTEPDPDAEEVAPTPTPAP
ncbi:MAG: hypothetical protein AAF614_37750 [Chloroflexota bacterium]